MVFMAYDKVPMPTLMHHSAIGGSMTSDLSRSPSVRMSADLDKRLRIAAAHEDMSKTRYIREVLSAAIEDLEADGLDEFRAQHETRSGRENEA